MFCLILAVICPFFAFIVPLFDFDSKTRAFLITFFLIGAPELFLFLGAILAGKEAVEFIKKVIRKILKRESPIRKISNARYGIGLWMLFGSIAINWGLSYLFLNIKLSPDSSVELLITAILDIITITSFFVLGGQFWEKLKRLFKYEPDYMDTHFPNEQLEKAFNDEDKKE